MIITIITLFMTAGYAVSIVLIAFSNPFKCPLI